MSTVYIIGSGPGDPELLTLKAYNLIKKADVIIYDHLINPYMLNLLKNTCIRIYVGKIPYKKRVDQEEINKLLVKCSLEYNTVVRLKGGDPFLFGRGGEEIEELIKNNINYDVVPGVSSLLAVPAYSGIPLTHRGINHGIIVTTGNNVENMNIPDCKYFNCDSYTLIIFMGSHNISEIIKKLLLSGYNKSTKIALIRNGTYNYQKTIIGTLENFNYDYDNSPSLIVVGNVVKYHEYFDYFEKRKYSGKILTVFYETTEVDTEEFENNGLTVFKIRIADISINKIDPEILKNRNIVINGFYIKYLMELFKINKFDIRNVKNIITDNYGIDYLKRYLIFNASNINGYNAGGDDIIIGFNSENLKLINKKNIEINSYIKDYLERSDYILFMDDSYRIMDDVDNVMDDKKILINEDIKKIFNHMGGNN